MLPANHDRTRYFAILALLEKNDFLKDFCIFKSNLSPEDDVTTKV